MRRPDLSIGPMTLGYPHFVVCDIVCCMHRNIEALVEYVDKKISRSQRTLDFFSKRKQNITNVLETYPDVKYLEGKFCLDDIKNQVSCMSLQKKYVRNYETLETQIDIIANFSLSSAKSNLKIYSSPINNIVASVNWPLVPKREIVIHNYSLFLGEGKHNKKFIKRIKLFLIKYITANRLVISKHSYDREAITKLMLLK